MTGVTLIIPAAGMGRRLGGNDPKVLAPVDGRPMIDHLIGLYDRHVDSYHVVVHPTAAERVTRHLEALERPVSFYEQEQPTGMLDAILLPAPGVARGDAATVWITWCDQIGIRPDTLTRLRELTTQENPASLTLPTYSQEEPYIHFERAADRTITAVLQRREADVMPDIGESDAGLFALARDAYLTHLPGFARGAGSSAVTEERNFLPFVPWLASRQTVSTFPVTDAMEAVGVNTPEERLAMEDYLRHRAGDEPRS